MQDHKYIIFNIVSSLEEERPSAVPDVEHNDNISCSLSLSFLQKNNMQVGETCCHGGGNVQQSPVSFPSPIDVVQTQKPRGPPQGPSLFHQTGPQPWKQMGNTHTHTATESHQSGGEKTSVKPNPPLSLAVLSRKEKKKL